MSSRKSLVVRRIVSTAFLVAGFPDVGWVVAQKTAKVHISVQISEKDVVIEQEWRPPKKALITHVRLAIAEPTFTPRREGFPELPFVTRTVAVPAKAQVEVTGLDVGKGISYQGVGLVWWAQPASPTGTRRASRTGGDENVYYRASDEVPPDPSIGQVTAWPKMCVERAGTRRVGEYDLVTFQVYPLQWFPAEDRLVLYPEISLDLVYQFDSLPPAPQRWADAMEVDTVRDLVVNPDQLNVGPSSYPPGKDTRYLIITDDSMWDQSITPRAPIGEMTKEFQRLAAWKTHKGVRAAVVRISDIVDGTWGDFRTGALDLQELLRNFLKYARREWSTYFVLLGGDVQVIPPREVVGRSSGYCFAAGHSTTSATPEEDQYTYHAASGLARIHIGDFEDRQVEPGDTLIALMSGRTFAQITSGAAPSASNPGWAFTDGSYGFGTGSGTTRYLIVGGTAADIQSSPFMRRTYLNTIPTDLYYASLVGPDYDAAGWHDWDKNNNGLYGQFVWNNPAEIDGVSLTANVELGRAPVASAAEARRFVDKVLAYEHYQGMPAGFGRKLLLTADDWAHTEAFRRTNSSPPPGRWYYSADASTTAVINIDGPPGPRPLDFRLMARNATAIREVPYSLGTSATELGYFYCTDSTCTTPSMISVGVGWVVIELPRATSWVRVTGPAEQVRPDVYYFTPVGPDGAVTEKEQVRTVLARRAPTVDQRLRLYKDYLDAPDYPAPDLLALSETAAQDALNTGYNLVSMSGHGWWRGCCGIDATWAATLTNDLAGGVAYADSCLTAEYNKPKGTLMDDSLAESMVSSMTGGMAAYVGYSRVGWIGVGSGFERAFWGRLETSRRLGALVKTKETNTGGDAELWINYAMTLMGDPEMPIWVNEPETLTVTHDSSTARGFPLNVEVRDEAGAPVRNAKVSLTGPGWYIAFASTNSRGVATVSTEEAVVGEVVTVTVTADDHLPYQGRVKIDEPFRIRRRLPGGG
jgi:hypothetical protein